jgi:hypothetical protein
LERFVISRLACSGKLKRNSSDKSQILPYLDEIFPAVVEVINLGSKSLEYTEDGGAGSGWV